MSNIREEFKIREKNIIAIIAALSFEKDHETFIQAAKELCSHRDDVHFLIIGEGLLKIPIKDSIKRNNLEHQITLTGFRRDVPNILNQIDVLVLTSTQEGLGSAILEAFANKVPVVATNVGGIPEVIEHGKTGLLSSPKDVLSIASDIEFLLNNPELASDITNNALQVLQRKFTVQQTESQTVRIYNELIQAEPKPLIELQKLYA